jgi:ABC-type transporter MlaC component
LKRTVFLLFMIFVLGMPHITFGSQPMDVLREAVDKAIRILDAPGLASEPERGSRLEDLWTLAREVIDFQEFANRCLMSDWNRFTAGERAEFAAAFVDFLKKAYLPRVANAYDGQRIRFVGEKIQDENNALVNVEVLWRDLQVPVEVRMLKNRSRWKVYDVVFFGVSIVGNYRVQIHSLLRTGSPAGLIEILKKKREAVPQSEE